MEIIILFYVECQMRQKATIVYMQVLYVAFTL